MTESIADWVQISPAVWSTKRVPVQPGDLRRFAPMGRGRIGPVPPDLDDSGAAPGNPDLFSLTAHHSHPLLDAPITEPTGGTLYLDGEPDAEDLAATLRLLGVPADATDYAALSATKNPAGIAISRSCGSFAALPWPRSTTPFRKPSCDHSSASR
jgi:hypothetical protein